jgi:hypothetical protein
MDAAMKRIRFPVVPAVAVAVTALVFLFHFLFLWINQHGDGYYYLAFAKYLATGDYPFMWPYMYARPTTIAAPLYSVVLRLLLMAPHAERLLHAYHLILLGLTAGMLYRMLRGDVGKTLATVIACGFCLLPTSLIFASYNMTEITAQFLFVLWLMRLTAYLKHPSQWHLGRLIFIAAVATLAKYQFSLLFLGSAAWWGVTSALSVLRVRIPHQFDPRRLSGTPTVMSAVPAGLGILLIALWVGYNWHITGTVGLSDTNRLRFQAALVYDGKYLPSESDPAVIELRKYIPPGYPLTLAWWDYQNFILPQVNHDWREVDRLVGNIGIAVLREKPWVYPVNTLRIFWRLHTYRSQPWWINISTVGQPPNPALPLYCNSFMTLDFCRPIIMTPVSYPWYNVVTVWMRDLYLATAPAFFVGILFPSLVICLLWGDRFRRAYALLYLIQVFAISASIFVDTRYLVVFYPLMILVIVGAATTAKPAVRAVAAAVSRGR